MKSAQRPSQSCPDGTGLAEKGDPSGLRIISSGSHAFYFSVFFIPSFQLGIRSSPPLPDFPSFGPFSFSSFREPSTIFTHKWYGHFRASSDKIFLSVLYSYLRVSPYRPFPQVSSSIQCRSSRVSGPRHSRQMEVSLLPLGASLFSLPHSLLFNCIHTPFKTSPRPV